MTFLTMVPLCILNSNHRFGKDFKGSQFEGPFAAQRKNHQSLPNLTPANLDGTVDARENWWGKDVFIGDQKLNIENPSFIYDGRDQPTFTEEGVDYPLDKVRFSPWLQEPVWQ